MTQCVPTKFKQLFKLKPPIDIFYKFLDLNFEYENNMYKVSGVFFNKCIYKNTLNDFCEKIAPFYHKSKERFANVNNDYNKFISTSTLSHILLILQLLIQKYF